MKGAAHARRGAGLGPVLALAALVLTSLGLLEYLDHTAPSRSRAGRARHTTGPRPPAGRGAAAGGARPAPARTEGDDWEPAGEGPGRVAIVIDDVGFEEGPPLELAHLGLPLTFAILPYQRHSRTLAARLRREGHEVILHLPMEPVAYPRHDPGEGAVSEGMGPAEIADAVRRDLDQVPQAVGVNNHMGSMATADPAVMKAVLGVVKQRGLYFLDSRTSADTVGFDMARAMGIPSLERSVFLDDRREPSYIEDQVRTLLRKARAQGSAVAIGHPDPATVEGLKRSVGLLRDGGIEVVPASELAGRRDGGSS